MCYRNRLDEVLDLARTLPALAVDIVFRDEWYLNMTKERQAEFWSFVLSTATMKWGPEQDLIRLATEIMARLSIEQKSCIKGDLRGKLQHMRGAAEGGWLWTEDFATVEDILFDFPLQD